MAPKQPACLLAVLFLSASSFLVLSFLMGQIRFATDLDVLDPNMRMLYIFSRFYDPELFPHDYTADYYLAMWTPPGFILLQRLWAWIADPLILQRATPIILLLSAAPMVFFSAKRIGGIANAWATLPMYLCSSAFLYRMAGGMAHGFAFPFLWWAIAALVSGRVYSLALCTILSAAFYPPATAIIGTSFAFWLLFPRLTPTIPSIAPAVNWPWQRKLVLLAITAVLAALCTGHLFLNHFHNEYGRAIVPFKEKDEFPECNYETALPPFSFLLLMFLSQNSARLGPYPGIMITFICMGVLIAGLFLHNTRDRRPNALRPFIYAIALFFLPSMLFDRQNAYRYVMYPVPILITLYLPLAFRRISRRLPVHNKGAWFVLLMLAYISCIAGSLGPEMSGYMSRLSDTQKQVITFVKNLPKNTMIAGWPGDKSGGIVENIPYFSHRQILVSWEGQGANHVNYVLTLRERMFAIVDAYLAQDISPIMALRDQFHVDYFVINEHDLKGDKPPPYFEPFDERAQRLWDANPSKFFMVLKLAKTASVYSHDGIHIIDLHRL